ncbi:helix-turn-helix domain-containing protein, partial [Weissella thailandensis]
MRLKELRKGKGMQQQEAAKELNIPGSTYAGYE